VLAQNVQNITSLHEHSIIRIILEATNWVTHMSLIPGGQCTKKDQTGHQKKYKRMLIRLYT